MYQLLFPACSSSIGTCRNISLTDRLKGEQGWVSGVRQAKDWCYHMRCHTIMEKKRPATLLDPAAVSAIGLFRRSSCEVAARHGAIQVVRCQNGCKPMVSSYNNERTSYE
jgi:hypothetical protein